MPAVDSDRSALPAFLSLAGAGFAVAVVALDSLWPAVGMTVMIALAVYLKRREDRRFLREFRGQCAACGYDLRATPERCPECGTAARS